MDANPASPPAPDPAPRGIDQPGQIGLLLRRAHRRAARAFGDELQSLGVENRHAGVLLQLAQAGPVTQRQLIDALGSDKSSMVRTIDEMEARGLVVRRPHPTDRRAHAVVTTEAGLAVLAEVRNRAEDTGRRLLHCLPPAEQAQLRDLLLRFIEADTEPTDAEPAEAGQPEGHPGE
ncbi:MarR family winged helix-turn-helix transcriptional regulator [Streptacidiphilus sp. EB129]|uniref:MarR family winged helix-turn-helix transcriptional regulator n=1 Tax=Streptacidiphilus sp. EB129 TaxID=3156262 RepID=UPI003511BD85